MSTQGEFKLKIGIIGGTGLNNVNFLQESHEIEVDTIFGKPSDKILCGKINNVDCCILSRHDKNHLTGPSNVNYRANLLALKNAGCNILLVTTACGSLNENYKPGDLAILDDFIDRTYKREQSYYDGSKTEFSKICHIPMYPAFSKEMRNVLVDQCEKDGLSFHKKATMVTIEGPRFSSRAESKMFQQWGGHTINMTTCPEVVLAKELGMPYASIAIVTDYDCWRDHVGDHEHVDVASVLKTFKESLHKVTNLIYQVVPRLAEIDWQPILEEYEKTVNNSKM
ncbi:unnamed protein product [Brachionus calyciflorus]|uniref:S-methyl-5'-thioadenosine phosphorylase n=1 Tax=Brachionus calyciflorus TaxID=104777 RepID=A0A813N7B0_9BILA|nr:unnamed protein product [Brachionus calyciflorus]